MTTKCYRCGKAGPIAEDQTDAAADELACDTRGLVRWHEYVCGECLDAAEDERRQSTRQHPATGE